MHIIDLINNMTDKELDNLISDVKRKRIEYHRKHKDMWKPINEEGVFTKKDFDKRFSIDRTYQYNTMLYKNRIRIVKYPNNYKNSVFITSIPRIPSVVYKWFEKNIKYGIILNYFVKTKAYEYTEEELKKYLKYKI